MMKSSSLPWKLVLLAVLGLLEAVCIYRTSFCVWMMAHPVYASPDWRRALYLSLTATSILGAVITVIGIKEILAWWGYRDEGPE